MQPSKVPAPIPPKKRYKVVAFSKSGRVCIEMMLGIKSTKLLCTHAQSTAKAIPMLPDKEQATMTIAVWNRSVSKLPARPAP